MDTQQGTRVDRSEYGVVGLLAGLGILVLVETHTISESLGSSRTLGPRVVPYFVGGFLLVVAVLLLVDLLRGGRGTPEAGEDVDLSHGTDWKMLVLLAAALAATGQLIPYVGFPIAGALMFFAVTRLLGGFKLWLDVVVSVVVSLAAFLLFTEVLGISMPWFGEM